jgi:hypothetical protein
MYIKINSRICHLTNVNLANQFKIFEKFNIQVSTKIPNKNNTITQINFSDFFF